MSSTVTIQRNSPSTFRLRQSAELKAPEISEYSGKADLFISKFNLTSKQFYLKMGLLTKQGLLVRKNGQYFLTTLHVKFCSKKYNPGKDKA